MIDHNGFLWIGTSNGINIYDPVHKKIKLFNPPDKNYAVLGKQIQCMLEDHNGDIWISIYWTNPGTRGIYRYNPSSGVSKTYGHSATDPHSLSAGMVNTFI